MPAGISALAPTTSSFEGRDSAAVDLSGAAKAFTILQKDGLDSSLPLLHVNGEDTTGDEDEEDDDSVASRMTMIRRCNYRNNDSSVFSRKQLSKSNDHLVPVNPPARLRGKDYSRSYGNLHQNSMHLSTEDFNQALNAKLRRIQEQEEEEQRRQAARNSYVQHPKPFITTVKTGEFLMPPPEVAILLGIAPNNNPSGGGGGGGGGVVTEADDIDGAHCRSRFRQQLVSLNRRPEVRNQMHNTRCQVALKATEDFSLGGTTSISALTSARKHIKKDCHQTEPPPFGNLMFDRRIMRGSMFTAAPTLAECEQSRAAKQAETRRRQIARKKTQLQSTKSTLVRIGTPPPVPGRRHEPVQTELYLEELFEKPDESDVAIQTEYFLDRPSTPPFCSQKTGQDASTQIEPGDLFDFDMEVQPILEVLVGKTVEQALLEVLEEEEIATLREQQRKFLELRAAEKAEQQRLEEQDRRLREEKDRRVRQHEEAVKTQQETEERVAAAVLLTGYVAELLPAVLEGLKISGFLLDEIKADVEEGFMPWLMKEVKKEIGTMVESKEILEEIVREIIENRANTYKCLGEEYDATRKPKVENFADICEGEAEEEMSINENNDDEPE